MKGFFGAVPRYLEEGAWIDGRSKLCTWLEILRPVAKPGLGVGDRIAVMSAGELQQVGTPDEVHDHPANLFMAECIGSPPMNLLPATRDGGTLIVEGSWRIPAPSLNGHGGDLTVGLRPEAISLSHESSPHGQAATVYLIEPLDSEVIVNVRLGEHLLKVRTEPRVRPEPEETVYLTAKPDGVRVFDSASGAARG